MRRRIGDERKEGRGRRARHGRAGEPERVEEQPLERTFLPEALVEREIAVFVVAEDGMADARQVHADLVHASGAELELEQRKGGPGSADPITGKGFLVAAFRSNGVGDRSCRGGRSAGADRQIGFRKGTPRKEAREASRRVFGLGDQKQAGGIFIQAMDEERPGPEPELEQIVDGRRNAFAALHGQPCGLVDDDDFVILEDDIEFFHRLEYSSRMARKSSIRAALFVLLVSAAVGAEPVVSPTWGFLIDLPEGFELSGGDRRNRFSFADAMTSANVDMVAYAPGRFASPEALLLDIGKRLSSASDPTPFEYRGLKAALVDLSFTAPFGQAEGWALAVELGSGAAGASSPGRPPLLVMLSYAKEGEGNATMRCLSALDSLAPRPQDRFAPGPMSVFAYPPSGAEQVEIVVGETKAEAVVDASDAEAAKALVDREFGILQTYANARNWKEAWTRFYRSIWRDSYERLAGVSFAVERALTGSEGRGQDDRASGRRLAEGALAWVQSFAYERDLMGSDFVDLVSAATERRGDCDSRALLWAIVVQHANLDAILMVSREYGHAMAAVESGGGGARFPFKNGDWIVAETTAKVSLGMIGKNVSDPAKWLGIDFPGLPAANADR